MNRSTIDTYSARSRSFLPEDFQPNEWDRILPFFEQLLSEEPEGPEGLIQWLQKLDELTAVLEEEAAWRFIRMSCDTLNEEKVNAYTHFNKEIQPHLSMFSNRIYQKIVEHPASADLPEAYHNFYRIVKSQVDLYREENIPLATRLTDLGRAYSQMNAGLTIEFDGKELTMQQAHKMLDEPDRALRKQIWDKIGDLRTSKTEEIDSIFDQMLELRNEVARNAGFDSYTAFRFLEKSRFDYTVADTRDFHTSVEHVVKPIVESFHRERKSRLGLDSLYPYDTQVDMYGDTSLSPFTTSDELLEGVLRMLNRLDPKLSAMLATMKEKGFLDLESRKGKMPGGYNYPLSETGIPFVFMNAVGSASDVITLLHESGHAVHSFLIRDLPLSQRNMPAEVSELAAMTMELLCLDFYDEFYPDAEERRRAQKLQIARCITVLSWIASIDAFQQWVYDHPGHSQEERAEAWKDLFFRFHGQEVDWSDYAPFLYAQWQKQPHVFEYPFYYIEYGMAQLGALAIWKNFRENPEKGLKQYLTALSMGYTHTIPEIYQAAGIRFDFSEEYVRESVGYCLEAYQSL